jgi:hypothetical protein
MNNSPKYENKEKILCSHNQITKLFQVPKMYTLNCVDSFQITDPADTYIYDLVPVAAGLVTISSDDTLRLLDPLALNGTPLNSIRRVNTDVTCLKALGGEGDALIVCTAGRDGRVCLMDPRSGAKIGQVRSGELDILFYWWREFFSQDTLCALF